MRDISTKADNVGDKLTAGDFNALNVELENIVTSSDQVLDPAGGPDTDTNMLNKAVAAYANAGSTYTDSGSADAYVLTIASNLKSPTKYFDNMTVRFKPTNTNTGVATVDVAGLGVKSIKDGSGADVAAGALLVNNYYNLVYNLSAGYFESGDIVTPSGSGGVVNLDSTIIGADSDSSGIGEIVHQIKGVSKGGVDNNGITHADGFRLDGEMKSDIKAGGFKLLNSGTILNQQTGPYYHSDSGNITVPDDPSFEVGTGNFTIVKRFRTSAVGLGNTILSKTTGVLGYILTKNVGDDKLKLNIQSGGNNELASDSSVADGEWHIVALPVDRSGNTTMILDGELQTDTVASPAGDLNNAIDLVIASSGVQDDGGTIIFNRLLTTDEAKSWSSNPQIALDSADEGATSVGLISGTVIIGKNYRSTDFIAGDDFSNVSDIGASANVDGAEWVAIATTPTTWTNSSEITQIGAPLVLKDQDFTDDVAYDNSGNGNDGVVTTATRHNKHNEENAPWFPVEDAVGGITTGVTFANSTYSRDGDVFHFSTEVDMPTSGGNLTVGDFVELSGFPYPMKRQSTFIGGGWAFSNASNSVATQTKAASTTSIRSTIIQIVVGAPTRTLSAFYISGSFRI